MNGAPICVRTRLEKVAERLAMHPFVSSIESGPQLLEIDGRRRIELNRQPDAIFGLVELMDNNPLVCTDRAAVPGALGTLALIALGPLAAAGMILEEPTLIASIEGTEAEVEEALASEGYFGGAVLHFEPPALGTVCALSAMALIPTPADLTDLDDLFEERYGKSFFVRKADGDAWNTEAVAGTANALYRLRITPDEPNSLFTVQVLADVNGKCGSAQVVHMMNVMCGFEETLGIV